MYTIGEQFLKKFWQQVVERVDSITQYLVYLCDTLSQIICENSTASLPIKCRFSNWNMVDFFVLPHPWPLSSREEKEKPLNFRHSKKVPVTREVRSNLVPENIRYKTASYLAVTEQDDSFVSMTETRRYQKHWLKISTTGGELWLRCLPQKQANPIKMKKFVCSWPISYYLLSITYSSHAPHSSPQA